MTFAGVLGGALGGGRTWKSDGLGWMYGSVLVGISISEDYNSIFFDHQTLLLNPVTMPWFLPTHNHSGKSKGPAEISLIERGEASSSYCN